jgi:hypothetical protein
MRDKRDIYRTLTRCVNPIDSRPIWEWCADNLTLPSSITKSGKFDIGVSNYMRAPLLDLQDNRIRRVNLRWPVRHAKTLVSDLWIAWSFVNDPGPTLSAWQTDELSKSHCESRFLPIIESCPDIVELFAEDRHKTRTQTIVFPGGITFWSRSGGAISELQSRSVRYLDMDEVWTWEDQSMIKEAEARIGDWEEAGLSKVLYKSQGSFAGDLVDTDWQRGSQHWWNFDCAKCGLLIPAKLWDKREDRSRWGLIWDEKRDSHNQLMIGETLATIRYDCPHCGHSHLESDGHRVRWMRDGQYVQANSNAPADHKSYTFSAIMGRSWERLVEGWINANASAKAGIITELQIFVQKYMAEPWNLEYVGETLNLSTDDYEPSKEWPDEVCRWLTVDVQMNGQLFFVVRAWSRTESRRLDFGDVWGWPSIDELQERWKVNSKRVWIDAGNWSAEVYRECAKRGWVACMGRPTNNFWHEVKTKGTVKRINKAYAAPQIVDAYIGTKAQNKGGGCILVVYSDERLSDQLHLYLNDPREIFKRPAGFDQAREKIYNRHMGSMKKVRVESKGKIHSADRKAEGLKKVQYQWVAMHKDNHLFDCEKMQVLAAMGAKLVPDPVEAGSTD